MVQRSALLAGAALAAWISGAASGAAVGLPRMPFAGTGESGAARLKPGEWPQAASDLPADPQIRFGALPNGMRFVIMHSATPPGQAALRLRIAAGSLMEGEGQQGLAHFIEHLAFDGSSGVPNGQLAQILQRHSLAFAPDTNANTDFEDAVYRFDLPKTDDDTVDTALMLLRETAGDLSLSPEMINQERGVVLGEQRDGDTASNRIFAARLAFLLPGQRPAMRPVLGKAQVIQAAKRAQIVEFYHHYYRPERATLIAVGDFDPAAMEAKIRARFGGWRGSGGAGADPGPGRIQARGLQSQVVVETGAPVSIQLSWAAPPELSVDNAARRKREIIEQLGLAVLNRRLAALAGADNPPFQSAAVFRVDEHHAARVTSILIAPSPDGWSAALAAADLEQRRAVAFGVRADELAEAVAEQQATLEAAAADAASRSTATLAAQLQDAVANDAVETSPAEDLAVFRAAVEGLTPEAVTAALKGAFEGSGPLLFVSAPAPVAGGAAALEAEYVKDAATPVTTPVAVAQTTWPYFDFGDPGKVADRREITDLDAVMVRFANGVRLTVKPTKLAEDQVLVKVRVGSGRLSLSLDQPAVDWAGPALIDGGFGKIDAQGAARALAPSVYGARFDLEDDAFALSGATHRDDLDAQLQTLAAYVTDPGWRPEAFQRAQAAAAALLDRDPRTDPAALDRDVSGLLHSGDRRWTLPDKTEISAASLQGLKRQLALGAGPIEVVVVGDITVDKAISAVAATFGALPARADTPAPVAGEVGFPPAGAAPVVITHPGAPDQALALAAWRTSGLLADLGQARAAALLGEILQLRLRAATSGAPQPRVTDAQSLVWPRWGYLSASVGAPPSRLDAAFAQIASVCADLRDREVSADEFAHARALREAALDKARRTNDWWLAALSGASTDPRRLTAIRSETAAYERATPADLRAVAQRYLRDEAMWKLEVRPAG